MVIWNSIPRFSGSNLLWTTCLEIISLNCNWKLFWQPLSDLETIYSASRVEGNSWSASTVHTSAFSYQCRRKISQPKVGQKKLTFICCLSSESTVEGKWVEYWVIHLHIKDAWKKTKWKSHYTFSSNCKSNFKNTYKAGVVSRLKVFLQLKNVLKRKQSLWPSKYFGCESKSILTFLVMQLDLGNFRGQRPPIQLPVNSSLAMTGSLFWHK